MNREQGRDAAAPEYNFHRLHVPKARRASDRPSKLWAIPEAIRNSLRRD